MKIEIFTHFETFHLTINICSKKLVYEKLQCLHIQIWAFALSIYNFKKWKHTVSGYTWSTVNKFNSDWNYTIPEPMDRIDFIFSQGKLNYENIKSIILRQPKK